MSLSTGSNYPAQEPEGNEGGIAKRKKFGGEKGLVRKNS